jgi:class 3 adenylate cyclase
MANAAATEPTSWGLARWIGTPPDTLSIRDSRWFLTAQVASAVAFLWHFAFIFAFAWLGVRHMAIANVVSCVMWLGVVALTRKSYVTTALSIATVEILVHAAMASQAVGWSPGFHYYVLAVPSMLFLAPGSMRFKVSLSALSAVFYMLLYWVFGHPGLGTPLDPDIANLLGGINAASLVFILGILANAYATNTDRAEAALEAEHDRSEQLLRNILPETIAERLKGDEEDTIAEGFSEASVLFADIVGFTELSQNTEPERVVEMLNEIFCMVDDLVDAYGLEKIKTIGDAYMVAAGVPEPDDRHADKLARFALELREVPDRLGSDLRIRIGMHTGRVVAGVIGKRKFTYDLWGDTVNTASRMESHGLPGKIHVSEAMRELLADDFELVERGEVEVKGKGAMRTFFLEGARGD